MIQEVSDMEEFRRIINQEKLVVVCFRAEGDEPSKAIEPFWEELSDEYSDAAFIGIDVDGAEDIAQEEEIREIPTSMLFKNGEKLGEIIGYMPRVLKSKIARFA